MAKWLLGFVMLFTLQAAVADDLKTSVAPVFKKGIYSGCVERSKEDHRLADMGVPVPEYCQCSSDRFVDSLTEDDFQRLAVRIARKKAEGASSADADLMGDPVVAQKLQSAALSCLLDNKSGVDSEAMKKALVAKCKEGASKNSASFTSDQLDDFCECSVDHYLQNLNSDKTAVDGNVDFKQEGAKAGMMCIDKLSK